MISAPKHSVTLFAVNGLAPFQPFFSPPFFPNLIVSHANKLTPPRDHLPTPLLKQVPVAPSALSFLSQCAARQIGMVINSHCYNNARNLPFSRVCFFSSDRFLFCPSFYFSPILNLPLPFLLYSFAFGDENPPRLHRDVGALYYTVLETRSPLFFSCPCLHISARVSNLLFRRRI